MLTGDQLLKLKERILLEKALGKSLKANKDVLFRSRNWIDEVAKDETQYKSKMYYTLSHTRTAILSLRAVRPRAAICCLRGMPILTV